MGRANGGKDQTFWSVIPAGGAGTRLWPLSRADRPKFLLPLLGDRSLLQQTYDRIVPYSTPQRTMIVAGARHASEIARQLPDLPAENIIIEPYSNGTGPAIGLAALLIRRSEPNAIMGSFAADHVITDEAAFGSALQTAQKAARIGWLTTIGLTPTRPETGYGYIERTDEKVIDDATGAAYRAAGFSEKPSLECASQFLATGNYLWNASMFIWNVDRLAEELATHQPELFEALDRIVCAWPEVDRQDVLTREWVALKSVTIDQGIMEQCDRIAVVPAEMGWSDVGDWHGLGELLEQDANQNSVPRQLLQHDASGCMVWSTSNRLVALVGVENLAIVDTPDALLILNRDRAQDVRRIVDQLKDGLEDFA